MAKKYDYIGSTQTDYYKERKSSAGAVIFWIIAGLFMLAMLGGN